jgi:hypothetical protein
MQTVKSFRMVLFILVFIFSLTACSSKKNSTESQLNGTDSNMDVASGTKTGMNSETSTGTYSSTDGAEAPEEAAGETAVSTNRKLVRNISMELEALEFDSTMDIITKEVTTSGGYIEKSEIQGDRYEEARNRYANLVIRIPSTKVDAFLNLVDKNTYVVNKQESTEDVTLAYVDTESHVKTLEIEQERLLALLEKTGKLEDIISLEDRLSDVRYELEKYASTLRTYDNLVEYSTLTLTVNEVVRITPVEGKNALDRMGAGLKNSIYNIRDGFVGFIVWLVVNGPYLIIWGVILVILARIGVKMNRRYNKTFKNSVTGKDTPQDQQKEDDSDK